MSPSQGSRGGLVAFNLLMMGLRNPNDGSIAGDAALVAKMSDSRENRVAILIENVIRSIDGGSKIM